MWPKLIFIGLYDPLGVLPRGQANVFFRRNPNAPPGAQLDTPTSEGTAVFNYILTHLETNEAFEVRANRPETDVSSIIRNDKEQLLL